MKHFAFILALFISCSALAQTESFGVDGNCLYWQKIYQTELSFEGLADLVAKDGRFADLGVGSDEMTCRILRIAPDFEALGFSRGLVPMYISGSDIVGSATIQYKEGRYRVTVSNIKVVQNVSGGLGVEGETNSIETWAVRNGALTKGFSKSPAAVLDAMFTGMFQFKLPEHVNANW